MVGNNRGIIAEDSADASGRALGVRVQKVTIVSNATGIFVHNSDGVRIDGNIVNDARGSGTTVGIEVDGTSDDNLIKGNSFVDATTDVIDNGTSNCWVGNTVGTGTVPSGGCD